MGETVLPGALECFTDGARRVVTLAEEEAGVLKHNYIDTEHILFGLIRERDGIAAKVLESLGISLDGARSQADFPGRGQWTSPHRIPFVRGAANVLELSVREATQVGQNYVDTEHILLSLSRQNEGRGALVLVRMGADFNCVRQRVFQHRSDAVANFDDVLTSTEVTALAKVFANAYTATALLQAAGLPVERFPAFGLGDHAERYWSSVALELRHGRFQGGRRLILAAAQRDYPGNSIFGAGA